MNENERIRILNMVKEGKITVEEAEMLLSAGGQKAQSTDGVVLKDSRGRKGKKLRVVVDAGDRKDAKVNINIPLSLLHTVGPLIVKNLPKEAKEKMNESGVDLAALFAEIEQLVDSGLEEDIINIDTGENGDKAKVRIYVE